MYAGDEYLSHEQQHPELYDDEGDPIDYPCEECGAEPGEECRPDCTGPSSQQWQSSRPHDAEPPNVIVRQSAGWWPSLVHAICEDCGWIGPTRDQNKSTGRTLIRCDQDEHRCE